MLVLCLPWPPSVNNYWLTNKNRRYISPRGIKYRDDVYRIASGLYKGFTGPVEVTVLAYPPDRRKRDIDNILKAMADALEHAGVFENDNQITKLLIERKEVLPPGYLAVTIEDYIKEEINERHN